MVPGSASWNLLGRVACRLCCPCARGRPFAPGETRSGPETRLSLGAGHFPWTCAGLRAGLPPPRAGAVVPGGLQSTTPCRDWLLQCCGVSGGCPQVGPREVAAGV
eukprot:6315070-Alexandrium_andersonii.AAC.1